ncbi:MAG: response regulator [Candidatus Acidiferrales bacterium]
MPRILVADDNTNIQKMVVLAFEERGVEVVAVGNGEAAVRRIPDANPDLVLADVFMPVRNGYEVCEFVKKDTRFAHVPVILLVGAFDPLDEKEARRVGADGVLKKPFVPPDPLIAMVMSALEKNPKVAAELAKARETPPEPPPPPVMEIAAKAEPKPLPNFPEPSPEEAAAIYGFGKGVRSLDDEPATEEAKTPKAPVTKAKDADEDEDDFDGAATATDWRRTGGMDFEIPENTAVDPAYSYGKDLAPITFPSEKEVPPKRIHVRDDELDEESVAPLAPLGQQLAPKSVEPEPASEVQETQSFAPYGMRLSAEPASPEGDAPAPWHESPAFQSAANNPAATEEEPAAQASTPKKEEIPAVIEMKQPAPASVATKTSQSSTPWTDLTAPPSEYPKGSWMTDSSSAPAAHVSAPEPEYVSEPAASAPAWRMEPAIAPPASSESSWRSPLESRPAHEHRAEEASAHEETRPRKKSWFADAIEAVREVVQGGTPAPAEQPVSTAHADASGLEAASERMPEPVVSTALVAPVREEVREQVHQEAVAAETAEVPPHFSEHPSLETKSDAKIITTPADSTPSHRDSALEMPPAAHVTPEPLLVRDEQPAFSSYEDHHEHAAALQSFPFPGEPEPTNGEPAADAVVASLEEAPAPIFAASEESAADESTHTDFSGLIPTAPPPNREALADIPFLMPSAAALEQVNSPQDPAPQANLDEVVQRVLERLEPQLHELLSKNLLKPLVENMLQAELAKRDK